MVACVRRSHSCYMMAWSQLLRPMVMPDAAAADAVAATANRGVAVPIEFSSLVPSSSAPMWWPARHRRACTPDAAPCAFARLVCVGLEFSASGACKVLTAKKTLQLSHDFHTLVMQAAIQALARAPVRQCPMRVCAAGGQARSASDVSYESICTSGRRRRSRASSPGVDLLQCQVLAADSSRTAGAAWQSRTARSICSTRAGQSSAFVLRSCMFWLSMIYIYNRIQTI